MYEDQIYVAIGKIYSVKLYVSVTKYNTVYVE